MAVRKATSSISGSTMSGRYAARFSTFRRRLLYLFRSRRRFFPLFFRFFCAEMSSRRECNRRGRRCLYNCSASYPNCIYWRFRPFCAHAPAGRFPGTRNGPFGERVARARVYRTATKGRTQDDDHHWRIITIIICSARSCGVALSKEREFQSQIAEFVDLRFLTRSIILIIIYCRF